MIKSQQIMPSDRKSIHYNHFRRIKKQLYSLSLKLCPAGTESVFLLHFHYRKAQIIGNQKESERSMQKVNVNEIPWSWGDSGVRYVMQGPHVEWGVLKLKAGQSSKDYGKHVHHEVEETFYFLSGAPKFVIEGEEHRVRPGDAYRIEPKEDHDLINDADEECVAVFIKFPYNPHDREER